MTSSTVVLLSLSIGLPLVLLALGVFYHAWVIARQPDPLDAEVTSLATQHTDQLLGELHRAMEQVQTQLTQQRQTLGSMLSDAAPAASIAPPQRMEPMVPAAEPVATDDATALHVAVRQLAAEGLSDRAIARRLRVGLEEVRMLRTRPGAVS
jgi:DNA-binding NarL/FixJ family response regulator